MRAKYFITKIAHMVTGNAWKNLVRIWFITYIRQLFLGYHNFVVNSLVLVLQASRRHQKLALLFSYNCVVSDLQCTLLINELSRGSVLCYENHYFYK